MRRDAVARLEAVLAVVADLRVARVAAAEPAVPLGAAVVPAACAGRGCRRPCRRCGGAATRRATRQCGRPAYGSRSGEAASSASVTEAPIGRRRRRLLDRPEAGVAEVDEERRRADPAVDLPRPRSVPPPARARRRRGRRVASRPPRRRLQRRRHHGLVEKSRRRGWRPSRSARAEVSNTRAGVSGRPAARRPVACANALAIAAAVGTIGGSPSPFAPRFGRFASGPVDEVDDDLGHVGDRRHLVVVEMAVHGDPGRRVDEQLLGERVADALDDAALDLARRRERVDDPPDVVDGDDALDRDDARPGSTATWAIWQPNVLTRKPSGFGPRAPEPSIVALPSFPVTSTMSASSAPSRERMRPSETVRSSAAISKTSAASPSSWRRTLPAALRTAGSTAGVVIEPPATGP